MSCWSRERGISDVRWRFAFQRNDSRCIVALTSATTSSAHREVLCMAVPWVKYTKGSQLPSIVVTAICADMN